MVLSASRKVFHLKGSFHGNCLEPEFNRKLALSCTVFFRAGEFDIDRSYEKLSDFFL
jgi:hypothetical protein